MKTGDILVFKGKGLAYEILSRLLKLFERKWDRWGWHTAILWARTFGGWDVLEATAHGVIVTFYETRFLQQNTRCYRWLSTTPPRKEMNKFFETHVLQHYDAVIYFWTALQYLIRHFFNHRIPRLLDDRFTCWELVWEFCEAMGKPLSSKYDCPILTDLLKHFEGDEDGTD